MIPTRADLKGARQDLRKLTEIAEKAGTEAGTATGSEILKSLRAELNKKIGDARESLANGMIDRQQFRKISQDAAREFNAGILRSLEQMRREGRQNTEEYNRLQRALKNVGNTGHQSGEQVRRGFVNSFRQLPALIRGGIAAGIVASFTLVANRIIRVFRNAANSIKQLLQEASTAALVESGFRQLAIRQRIDPDELIRELRRGTRGLVADIEIYRLANRALQGELPLTAQQMGQLAEVARRVADQVGGDAAQAFDTLIQAIGRGRMTQLQQIGLFVDQRRAFREWEQQTGRTQGSMTDLERRTVLLNATIAEANRLFREMGADTLTPGERIQQLGIAWQNLKTSIALAIAESPRVIRFLDDLGNSAEGSADQIQHLANQIGALFDTILESRALSVLARGLRLAGAAAAAGQDAAGPGRGIPRGFVFDRAAFQQHMDRREREQAIRAETDLEKILERQAEIRQQINDLITQGLNAERSAEVARLGAIERALDARRQELERMAAPPDGGRPDGEPDPDAAARAQRAADARLRIEQQLHEQVARLALDATDLQIRALDRLEAEYVAAGGRIQGTLAEQLEQLRRFAVLDRDLAGLSRELAEISRAPASPESVQALRDLAERTESFRDAVAGSIPHTERLDALLGQINQQVQSIEADALIADLRQVLEARRIELQEALARDLISETEFRREGERAGAAFNAGVLARIDELRETGLDELADQLVKALEGAPTERQQREQRLRDLRDQARAIEENVRGALQLAEAFGLIGGNAANALQNIAQIGTSIARFAAGDTSAIVPGLGALASLGQSLFGSSAEDRERRRILRENTRALERLAAGLADLSGLAGEPGRIIAGVGAAIRESGFRDATSPTRLLLAHRDFEAALASHGLTMRDAERIAQSFGITLDKTRGSLLALDEAITQLQLDMLFQTTEGQLRLMQIEERIRRIDDPVELLERRRRFLLEETALRPEDRQALQGFDLGTAEGQAAFEAFMLELFRRISTGEMSAEELGGLSVDRLLELIDSNIALIERAQEGGDAATEGFQVVRTITEVTANRMVGTLTTISALIDMYGRAVAENTAGILANLSGGRPLAPPTVPPGIRPEPPSAAAGASTIEIGQIGPFNFEGADPAIAAEAGDAAAGAFIRRVDQELAHRWIDSAIARGRR